MALCLCVKKAVFKDLKKGNVNVFIVKSGPGQEYDVGSLDWLCAPSVRGLLLGLFVTRHRGLTALRAVSPLCLVRNKSVVYL